MLLHDGKTFLPQFNREKATSTLLNESAAVVFLAQRSPTIAILPAMYVRGSTSRVLFLWIGPRSFFRALIMCVAY